jgi:hypothetical protein
MGMISGTVTGDSQGVSFPTNLLFREADDYTNWQKHSVDADRNIEQKSLDPDTYHIFIRNQAQSTWQRVDSPDPFLCTSSPQDLEVQIS